MKVRHAHKIRLWYFLEVHFNIQAYKKIASYDTVLFRGTF